MLKTLDVQKDDYIKDPSLVLDLPLYRLDGQKFTSADKHGHLCTVTGALWQPDGRVFDGDNDTITIPNHASLIFGTGDFTVMAWGKTVAVPTDTNSNIISRGSIGAGDWMLRVASSSGKTSFSGDQANIDTDLNFPDIRGAWHLLTFVRAGDNGILYTDTTAIKTITGIDAVDLDSTVPLTIGGTSTRNWDGNIGEVWLYNRALNPLEIQRNYLATKWRYQ